MNERVSDRQTDVRANMETYPGDPLVRMRNSLAVPDLKEGFTNLATKLWAKKLFHEEETSNQKWDHVVRVARRFSEEEGKKLENQPQVRRNELEGEAVAWVTALDSAETTLLTAVLSPKAEKTVDFMTPVTKKEVDEIARAMFNKSGRPLETTGERDSRYAAARQEAEQKKVASLNTFLTTYDDRLNELTGLVKEGKLTSKKLQEVLKKDYKPAEKVPVRVATTEPVAGTSQVITAEPTVIRPEPTVAPAAEAQQSAAEAVVEPAAKEPEKTLEQRINEAQQRVADGNPLKQDLLFLAQNGVDWGPTPLAGQYQEALRGAGDQATHALAGNPPGTQEDFLKTLAIFGLNKEQYDAYLLAMAAPEPTLNPQETTGIPVPPALVPPAVIEGTARVVSEEPQEAQAQAEAVLPTYNAVDKALEELLQRYVPDKEKRGKGWVRGAVLPLVGAFSAGRVASILGRFAHLPIPGFAALTAFGSSVAASGIRRYLGENAFSLWARYSHTEGYKEEEKAVRIRGRRIPVPERVLKIGQLLTRGAERAALRRILGLTGSKEVRNLSLYDEGGFIFTPANDPAYARKLIQAGIWYALGTKAAEQLGATFTVKEIMEIRVKQPKVIQATNEILNSLFPNFEERNSFLADVYDEIDKREKRIWAAEMLTVAGLGATKAALLSGVGMFLHDKIDALLHPKGVSGVVTPKEELPPLPKESEVTVTPLPGATQPQNVVPSTASTVTAPQVIMPPAEVVSPIPETIRQFTIHDTVGHTLVSARNGLAVDWTDEKYWQTLLAANDHETSLWQGASNMVKAIIGNPDKVLAGLDEETKKQILEAARASQKALDTAGFDATKGLTKINGLSLSQIKDLFHWVKAGQTLFIPDSLLK